MHALGVAVAVGEGVNVNEGVGVAVAFVVGVGVAFVVRVGVGVDVGVFVGVGTAGLRTLNVTLPVAWPVSTPKSHWTAPPDKEPLNWRCLICIARPAEAG